MRAKLENSVVIIYNELPNRYKIGGVFYNLNTMSDTVKEQEGFYTIQDVEITDTQIKEDLIESDFNEENRVWIYRVRDLTQEEIDANIEAEEENEAHEAMRKHIEKGIKLHARSYRKIWRKVVNKDEITKAKGRKLFRWLKPTWEDLKNGDFRQAYKSISDVLTGNENELQNEPVMLDFLEWFKDLINEYKSNKYDL